MKLKNHKSTITESILSIQPLADTWQYFKDKYKSSNPREAFSYANRGKFSGDIYSFKPVFTPFEDFDAQISKFELTNSHYKIDVDKFIFHDENTIIDDDEFVRLVLVHILHEPADRQKPKFLIFNTCSEPKPFAKSKKYKFRVPVPFPHLDDVNSYRHQSVHAFFVNYFINHEINPDGTISYFDNIFSFSSSESLNILRLSDSDFSHLLPPTF